MQNQAAAASAGFDASVADFFALATPDEQQQYNDGYSGAEVDRRRGFAQTALIGSDPTAALDIDLATLQDTSDAANNKLRGVETNLIASLRTQASGLANEATTTAWQVALIVVGAMLVALLLMLAMAQSLVNPLRRLRRGALKVANTTLPKTIDRILADANPVEAAKNAVAPMPVDTSEEIGQVARSFDVVHERAVRLATEQAVLRDNVNDMFVNLSRRSQALVERQLSELDKLEQTEQDPDQLAHFFVLDHLAARMRRNSENLLILSGVGVARRSSQPVPITEVIGAAQSEIESYARVVVKQGPDTVVQGRVVNDVVHLMAELLDNATKFSAADTEVTVTSAHIRSGELAVQISDQGLGLSDEELADINRRLIDPPPFDLAVSRRMGLYVVARLAKRHDIRVRLHGEFNSGTSAVVILPKALTGDGAVAGPTSPVPAITTGQTEMYGLTQSQAGAHTTIHTGPQSVTRATGPLPQRGGPHTGPQTGAHTGSQPVTHTGSQPVTRTGPQSGVHTGSQSVTRTGPMTGPQTGAMTGPVTGAQPGPPTGPQPPAAPQRPGTERPSEPAHAAGDLGRSAWFQRTVPATAASNGNGSDGGETGGGNGNGNGNGHANGNGGAADAKTAQSAPLNWGTSGEDGWSAVRRKLGETTQHAKVNDDLPRRNPGTHLVPGSAGPAQPSTGMAGRARHRRPRRAPPQRTADRVRSRLSGFQEGYRGPGTTLGRTRTASHQGRINDLRPAGRPRMVPRRLRDARRRRRAHDRRVGGRDSARPFVHIASGQRRAARRRRLGSREPQRGGGADVRRGQHGPDVCRDGTRLPVHDDDGPRREPRGAGHTGM